MSVVLIYSRVEGMDQGKCISFSVILINVAIKFPSIECVHSDITVASGLKLHGTLCVMCLGAMKNMPETSLFLFSPIFLHFSENVSLQLCQQY